MQPGEYNIVCEAWIVSGNKLLVTQRCKYKNFGGLWECTGGAVKAGESSIDCIKREIKEEIGIDVADEELTFKGTKHGSLVNVLAVNARKGGGSRLCDNTRRCALQLCKAFQKSGSSCGFSHENGKNSVCCKIFSRSFNDAFQRNGNLDWGQQLCDDLSVLYCCFFSGNQRGLAGTSDSGRNLFLFYHVGLCDV